MKHRNFIATSIMGSFAGNSLWSESFAQSTMDKPRAITNKRVKSQLMPFYIQPDYNANGGTKIRFNQTDNQFSAVEFTVPPKRIGTAPYVHKDLDEIMRVVKGTVTIMVGDEHFEVKEGGWHLRPHGIVHTFWNAGDEPATFTNFYTNQNMEFFLNIYDNLFPQFEKEGIDPVSKEGRRRQDPLMAEWGIVMYHDQLKPLMDKYGLK